ncbi:MAG TPA: flagellar export chaperone FliS [Anaeromyxobacteraceae bacterium]|nr:flagellar export chaperone FliS [Anaeromyxobacteraceae bacterium]
MNPTRHYAKQQNETASPERLMVLLFETALRQMRGAVTALEQGRSAEANAPLTRATDIVAHLDATFDPSRNPELAKHLGAVYRFVCQRLLSGKILNDAVAVREAERVFFPVANAFATAVQRLSTERATQAAR